MTRYSIVEEERNGKSYTRGFWENDEYDDLMETWERYVYDSAFMKTKVQMFRNGKLRITCDNRRVNEA